MLNGTNFKKWIVIWILPLVFLNPASINSNMASYYISFPYIIHFAYSIDLNSNKINSGRLEPKNHLLTHFIIWLDWRVDHEHQGL